MKRHFLPLFRLALAANAIAPFSSAAEIGRLGRIEPLDQAAERAGGEQKWTALQNAFNLSPANVLQSQAGADLGGNTSIRNQSPLHWKEEEGYFRRARDLGQVVLVGDHDITIGAIVLRTGPKHLAFLEGSANTEVFIEWMHVTGKPTVNDSNTAKGTPALHGFTESHRGDDTVEGVVYTHLEIARGTMPDLRDPSGDGSLVYLMVDFDEDEQITLLAGQQYAFLIGFVEPGHDRNLALANSNSAGISAEAELGDETDAYRGGWAIRREGDGTMPPLMVPGKVPPADPKTRQTLIEQAAFPADETERYAIQPSTNGYPDVDTYRDFEFYLLSPENATRIHPRLPDPLTKADGTQIQSAKEWEDEQRPFLIETFKRHIYGRAPNKEVVIVSELIEENRSALQGLATRRNIRLTLSHGPRSLPLDLLVYLPNEANSPVPAFLAPNFDGNHSIVADEAIPFSQSGIPGEEPVARGAKSRRFPIETIIRRGFAFVTVPRNDIDPDFDDGFKNGVHGLFDPVHGSRQGDDWGTVAAWAWGLSRVMDHLVEMKEIDSERVALVGHSRLGKAALWAGALDERFAMIVSNDSGNSGAALARRPIGESVALINDRFPHWFAENYRRFNEREFELPVDQHALLALVAPRPLYVASASEDQWADPQGEYLSWINAVSAYQLYYDIPDVKAPFPSPGQQRLNGPLGYHLRDGKHDLLAWDWDRFLEFAAQRL